MVVTKNELIKAISKQNQIPPAVVSGVLTSLEKQVIACLSLASPAEDTTVKIWNGLYIHSCYEKEQVLNKGFFQNQTLSPRLRVKAETTRTFCRKVNQTFDTEKTNMQ